MGRREWTIDAKEASARLVVVLGMHRSGTSLLAGMLHDYGLAAGPDLVGANASNPGGHWEDVEGLKLNERILRESGGGWRRPPERVRAGIRLQRPMRQFAHRLQGQLPGFWKDPRTTLTLPLWRPLLPGALFVGVFRNPAVVADSLRRRDAMALNEGLRLWKEYNSRLLAASCERGFPLLDFDAGPEVLRPVARRLAVAAGTAVPENPRDPFDPALRRSCAPGIRLPAGISELHRALKRRATGEITA